MSFSAASLSTYDSQSFTGSSKWNGCASSAAPAIEGARQNDISRATPRMGLPSARSLISSSSRALTHRTTFPHQHEPHRVGARPGSATSPASSEGCGCLGFVMVGAGYQGGASW